MLLSPNLLGWGVIMASTQTGKRGVYRADVEARLPYQVFDADNHIYPPPDAEIRHLEKKYVQRAFPPASPISRRGLFDGRGQATTGGEDQRYNGAPATEHGSANPLTLPRMKGNIRVPGATLNRLNPMRNLDGESRRRLVQTYREMEPAFENREMRLKLMDVQGIQAVVIHADEGSGGAFDGGAFKRGDVAAGYAAARAWNRYLQEDWGFAYEDRIFTPAYVPPRRCRPGGGGA